ncbi:ribosomal protein S18-alanine N-acetyltransferase [Desulfobulbus sp.]|uniref:ribosomal protein S18-alanine N-acetyltransferase n=1 Tax=Desulfobulbus sp. TaxID=895 RepID=UPI0027B9A3E8|nr:ribosomal protein S18-alanine N-acetyltransferase [Desulfobulbus sp.]
MRVRLLEAADLEPILRIEQRAMANPWNEGQLRAEQSAGNGIAWAAESGNALCGYAFFRTCAPECELLHLVVAPERRRQGVGADVLQQALAYFAGTNFAACFLEVRTSNQAARQLYGKFGFVQVGQRKNYYNQPVEDALLLRRNLIESS